MMRITNSIIANNSKINVNGNKVSVDKLNQQMSDQKKIHSPSEDPVIAIRSLRLRGALNQIDQYYTKNIPDAMSWLDITETALTNMKGLISTVSKQCVYGANDPLEKEDRKVIMDELSETRKQIYSEGNADYAGRTLFTGWKTQEFLTFQTDDHNSTYKITEKFKAGDLEDITYVNNRPDVKYGEVKEIMEDVDKLYNKVESPTGNPFDQGWFECDDSAEPHVYTQTKDSSPVTGKTYYEHEEVIMNTGDNPKAEGLYEYDAANHSYVLTNDTTVNTSKKYYAMDKQSMPTTTETARLALGYNDITDPSKLDPTVTEVELKYYFDNDLVQDPDDSTKMVPKEYTIKCKIVQLTSSDPTMTDTQARDAAYNVEAKDPADTSTATEGPYAHFIPETGEIILNNSAKLTLRNADDISFTYSKTGFQEGELRPEHYYDCEKSVDEEGNVIKNVDGKEEPIIYTKEDNPIDYTVSFNQTIRINTEASEVFNSRMARSIDDMITALQNLDAADEKIENIKKMMEEPRFAGEEDQEKLQTMLNAAQKEKDLWDDNVQKLFEKNISVWQGYLDKVDLAITDCGSRYARVELTESRMASQQTTFKKLKSTNEDRELSDIIIDYTSASTAYQSSLKATGKALQQSLLDYI